MVISPCGGTYSISELYNAVERASTPELKIMYQNALSALKQQNEAWLPYGWKFHPSRLS